VPSSANYIFPNLTKNSPDMVLILLKVMKFIYKEKHKHNNIYSLAANNSYFFFVRMCAPVAEG
jgi:hypothetical protein